MFKYRKKRRFIKRIRAYIDSFEEFYYKSDENAYTSYSIDSFIRYASDMLDNSSNLKICLNKLRYIKREKYYLDFLKYKKRKENLEKLIINT